MTIDFDSIYSICDELRELHAHQLADDLSCATSREAISAVHKDVLNGGYLDLANSISEAAGLYQQSI